MTTTSDQRTLASRMSEGKIPVPEALHYAMSLAEALRKLHDAGRSHGAISPSSIALTATGLELIPALGPPAAVTPYTAPEVLQGHPADARSDVFSFGALVFEMLTGRRAFDGASQTDLTMALCNSAPPSSGSPAVDRLVSSCVAKAPEARWQRMQKIIMELKLLSVAARRADATPAARGVSDTALRSEIQQLEGRLAARLAAYEKNVAAMQQLSGDAVESLREQLAAVNSRLSAIEERPVPAPIDVEVLTAQIQSRVEQTISAVTRQLETQVHETVAAANQQHTAQVQEAFGSVTQELASRVRETVDAANRQHAEQLQETTAAAHRQHAAEMQEALGSATQELTARVQETVDAANRQHTEHARETIARAQQLHTEAQEAAAAAHQQHTAQVQESLGSATQELTARVQEAVDAANRQHAEQAQETIARAQLLQTQVQETVAAANRQHTAQMEEALGSVTQELVSHVKKTVDAANQQHAEQVKETVARAEQQVGASNEAVAAVNQRIAAHEQSMEEIRKHFATLQSNVAGDLHDFEMSLKAHGVAIDSARTAMAQTDDLVERVVEALELLQSSLLDQHETAGVN